MGVVRELSVDNYSVDATRTAIADEAKRRICTCHDRDSAYVPVARRCYPIDSYPIPPALASARQVNKLQILKLPLLGQAGYRYYWCGRTSAAMIYNWFKLTGRDGQSPKADYITHWDADETGFRLNLRLPDKTRAFTSPVDELRAGKPADSDDYQCGGYLDGINAAAGRGKYADSAVFPYSPKDREQEGKRIAQSERDVRERFRLVTRSLDLNNPVHFDTGLTIGRNHFVVVNGYATINVGGIESLWLCVANPAGVDGWLSTLDLTRGATSLEMLTPAHEAITLVGGDWDQGRAAMQLIRASVFFMPKAELPGLQKEAKQADLAAFAQQHALVLDDIGNSNAWGGRIIYGQTATSVPADAVLSKDQFAFPLDISGVAACPVAAYDLEESRPKDAGGFYPLGLYGNLHGGVHMPTADAGAQAGGEGGGLVPVHAIAPGRVIAARLHHAGVADLDRSDQGHDQDVDNALCRELAGASPNFVLVRHELKVTKAGHESDPPIVFFCLYMHLAEPSDRSTGKPYGGVRWLAELNRRRLGTLVVVDSDAALGGERRQAGLRLWPAEAPPDKLLSSGSIRTYASGAGFEVVAIPLPATPEGRVMLAAKDPDPGVEAAVKALDGGKVVTYPEAHVSSFVDTGSVVGWAEGGANGFVHWEILAPAGAGLRALKSCAEEELGPLFKSFSESNANNILDGDEVKQLMDQLPDGDAKGFTVADKTFAQPHDPQGARPDEDHYLLTVMARPYNSALPPHGTSTTLKLAFTGTKHEESAPPVTLDFSAGVARQVVNAPGWATGVSASSDGYMVRAVGLGQLYDDASARRDAEARHTEALKAHVASITKSRWRNLLMTHLNEWCASDMSTVVTERHGQSELLDRAVRALSWWGADETPAFGSGKVFGTAELPASTKIDNLNPVTALWVLNLLLERGVVAFVSPKAAAAVATSSALFAGWLPAATSRAPQRVGEIVRAMVIRDREAGDSLVAVSAVDSSGAVSKPIPIGRPGNYAEDAFVVGDFLSAWGKFTLSVQHQGKTTAEQPQVMGAAELEILTPRLAPANPGPAKEKDGRWSWNVTFEANCPAKLQGYVVVRTKSSTGDYELQDLGLPVEAVEVPWDPEVPRWAGEWLVSGPKTKVETEVVRGVQWQELVAASGGEPPARVARPLLEAVSRLREAVAGAKTRIEGLRADGCAVSFVVAASPRIESDRKTVLINASSLKPSVLTSVEPFGPDPATPESIRIAVDPPSTRATPSGVMRFEFAASGLFGAALRKLEAGPTDAYEAQLGCRFVNGGHLLHQSLSAADEPEVVDIPWGADASTVRGFSFLELRSGNRDATLSRPGLGPVKLVYRDSGVEVRVPLVGGDAAFWKAAGMVMIADGRIKKQPGGAAELVALFHFCGPGAELEGRTFTVEIKNTKDATYHGVYVHAEALRATTDPINTQPEVLSVSIEPPADTSQSRVTLTVSAQVQGISSPWGLKVWAQDERGKTLAPVGRTYLTSWTYPRDGATTTYFVAGPDLVAKALLTFRRADLEGHALTVFVGRDAEMAGKRWPAAEKSASAVWSLPPTP